MAITKRRHPKQAKPEPTPAEPALEVRPITPADWNAIEELFGQRGACGGCWCMYWRAPSKRAFDELKGERARRAFKGLVTAGEARGILALAGDRPVGWCSLGPRATFPLTETKRSYAVPDAAEVWSVNCFFVQREWRGRGVSRRLLAAAVDEARRAGARVLEGYPVVTRAGRPQPGAFIYKGTLSLFDAAGFRVHQRTYRSSPLVRLDLAPRRPASQARAKGAGGSNPPKPAVRSRDA